LQKRVLDALQHAVACQAFDRRHGAPGDISDRYDTRTGEYAIDQHTARATSFFTAAVLRAGQAETFSEPLEECDAFRRGTLVFLTVDHKGRDSFRHRPVDTTSRSTGSTEYISSEVSTVVADSAILREDRRR
jgi:hypothetical protein